MDRLGMPCRTLPRLNVNQRTALGEVRLDRHTEALLRRRYAADFWLGDYEG